VCVYRGAGCVDSKAGEQLLAATSVCVCMYRDSVCADSNFCLCVCAEMPGFRVCVDSKAGKQSQQGVLPIDVCVCVCVCVQRCQVC